MTDSSRASRSLTSALAACVVALSASTTGCADEPAPHPALVADAGHGAPPKKNCRPEYPAAALRAHAEGTTVIGFTVDDTGAIAKVEILRSAGPTPEHQSLDQAAVSALGNCPFKLGTDATGKRIGGTVQVEYHWAVGPSVAQPPPFTPR